MFPTGNEIVNVFRNALGGTGAATTNQFDDFSIAELLNRAIQLYQSIMDEVDPMGFMVDRRRFTLIEGQQTYTERELLYKNDTNFGQWDSIMANNVTGTTSADGTATKTLIDATKTFTESEGSTIYTGAVVTSGANIFRVQKVNSATILYLGDGGIANATAYIIDVSNRGIRNVRQVNNLLAPALEWQRGNLSELPELRRQDTDKRYATTWVDKRTFIDHVYGREREVWFFPMPNVSVQIEIVFSFRHPRFFASNLAAPVYMNVDHVNIVGLLMALQGCLKFDGAMERVQKLLSILASTPIPNRDFTVTEVGSFNKVLSQLLGSGKKEPVAASG
jgi:hypothetical protein